jgi:hypothetical protein
MEQMTKDTDRDFFMSPQVLMSCGFCGLLLFSFFSAKGQKDFSFLRTKRITASVSTRQGSY